MTDKNKPMRLHTTISFYWDTIDSDMCRTDDAAHIVASTFAKAGIKAITIDRNAKIGTAGTQFCKLIEHDIK